MRFEGFRMTGMALRTATAAAGPVASQGRSRPAHHRSASDRMTSRGPAD